MPSVDVLENPGMKSILTLIIYCSITSTLKK